MIDVIITCYNKAQTIVRAIESVKRQTVTDFKCFVVDDGSTDNSWEIINQTIADDTRFVAIRLDNCGVANARNIGISYGNAPYICCLDGDDGLQSEFLETCYNAIIKDRSIGIVYTELLLYHPDNNFTIADWKQTEPNEQFNGKNQVPCCNLFRRDIFERVGGYKQRYAPNGAGAEDAELWLRFFQAGYTAIKITENPLFIYSTFSGITQSSDYHEVNWTNWHTQKPFPSLRKPDNGIAHTVNEYDNPEVSVIIPVCEQHLHYLPDALDSLEAQTYRNWEVIVIFDVADSTLNGVSNDYFEKAYPYARFIYTSGGLGAGAIRNIGIREEAKGEYIVFLDADDYLQTRFIELTLSAIKHFNADWIYTDLYTQTIYNEEQYKLKCNELDAQGLLHREIRRKNGNIEFFYEYHCDEWDVAKLHLSGIAPVTALYRKTDLEAVGSFDEKDNREDWDLHLRLAKAGKCGLRLPLPLFTYRLNTGIRREYKDVAQNENESKALKQKDIDRLHNVYNLEELKMACTSCKKNKITITQPSENDYTTLVYIGKNAGGTVKGPVTQKPYTLNSEGQDKVIYRVHPQDAQVFVKNGLFKPKTNTIPKPEILVAPTPVKPVVKEISHKDRLQASLEFAEKAQTEARALVEKMFAPSPLPIQHDFILHPENYSISELQKLIESNNLTQDDLTVLYDAENQGKNRKGLIKLLNNLIS